MTQDADQRRGVGQKIRNNARNIGRWGLKVLQSFTGLPMDCGRQLEGMTLLQWRERGVETAAILESSMGDGGNRTRRW